MTEAVRLDAVARDYGPVRAVDGIDLSTLSGQTVALLGPNGEREVLACAADGATIADLAARLHLSESTVRNYLSAAIGKTGTRNRMEALRTARGQGWL